MTFKCTPAFTAEMELDFALRNALASPRKAIEALYVAIGASVRARRPDLTYRANTLLASLGGR